MAAIASIPAWSQRAERQLLAILWITYFSLAPVVWLPGINPALLAAGKATVLVAGVIATWTLSVPRDVPRGLLGPTGLALLCLASVFSLLQASSSFLSLRQLWEILIAFGVLWTIRLFHRDLGDFARIASVATMVHGALSALVVLDYIGLIPSIGSSGISHLPLEDTGFGAVRSGWSIGVSALVPFGVFAALSAKTRIYRATAALSITVILAGQVVVGSRAGLLGSLVGLALMTWQVYGKRGLLAAAGILTLTGIAASQTVVARLRLGLEASRTEDVFDYLSTGRVTAYREGLQLIRDRPITGYGFGNPVVNFGLGGEGAIHNVWLRLWAEGGILLVGGMFAVVAAIMRSALIAVRPLDHPAQPEQNLGAKAALAALTSGLVVTFLEPAVVIGSMFNASTWWAVAGMAAAGAAAVAGTTAFRDDSSQSREPDLREDAEDLATRSSD